MRRVPVSCVQDNRWVRSESMFIPVNQITWTIDSGYDKNFLYEHCLNILTILNDQCIAIEPKWASQLSQLPASKVRSEIKEI